MARSTVAVRFTGEASKLQGTIAGVDKSLGGLGGKASKMSTAMKVGLTGAAGLAVKFGKDSVQAFTEAEASQAQLDAAFAKFPALAGANADALRGVNEELARKTKFDDDAIASGQAVLAQFDLNADQLSAMTPLLLDYAERTGKDLPTAAKDLGKAVQGQGKALKAVGIQFKDTGSKAGNLEQLLGGLDAKVGGLAETAGGTTAGKLKILSNQFGEVQEEVGARLVPALTALASALLGLLNWFSSLSPAMKGVIGVIAGLVAVVFTIVKAVQAWTAVQTALNVVLTANPIGLIIVAIAAFVAGIVVAYQKVDWFRAGVDTAFRAVKGVILGVFNWVKSNWPLLLAILTGPIGLAVLAISKHWGTIKAGVTAVKDWIVARFNDVTAFLRGVPGAFGDAMSGAADMIKRPFEAAFSAIKRLWNNTVGGFGFSVPSWVPFAGGKSFHIPTMHTGGIFDSGQGEGLALLKDGEGVFTPAQMAAMGGRGGPAPAVVTQVHHHYHIAGSVLAERDLIALINKAERKGIR